MISEVHRGIRSGTCLSWIAGLVLLALFPAAAGAAKPPVASAGKPCVAVLALEDAGSNALDAVILQQAKKKAVKK